MLLSKGCMYGVQAAVYVASCKEHEYVRIQEIASTLHISGHFLAKIVNELIQKGIMISYRGPNGGVALAKAASSISLADVIAALQGDELFHYCLFGVPCFGTHNKDIHTPCPAHEHWAPMRNTIYHLCSSTSLESMAERVNVFQARLSNMLL